MHRYTVAGGHDFRAENNCLVKTDWLSCAHALSVIITNSRIFDASKPLGEARKGRFNIITNYLNIITDYFYRVSKYMSFETRFHRLILRQKLKLSNY